MQYRRRMWPLSVVLIIGLILFWLHLSQGVTRPMTTLAAVTALEASGVRYHYAMLHATIYTVICISMNMTVFTSQVVPRLMRQTRVQYFMTDLKVMFKQALYFTTIFYGVDVILFNQLASHTIRQQPAIWIALSSRYLLAIGFYLIQLTAVYLITLITHQVAIGLLLVPVLTVISLKFCLATHHLHPLASLGTFDHLGQAGIDLAVVFRGGIQTLVLIIGLVIWNCHQLKKCDVR